MLRERARRLRQDQPAAERRLWARLRGRQVVGAKFRRQQPISPFIVDFCCLDLRLVVELGGGQHAMGAEYDAGRTAFLSSRGYRVLRFWDNEVLKETEAVMQRITQALRDTDGASLSPSPSPSPYPLPHRGRG